MNLSVGELLKRCQKMKTKEDAKVIFNDALIAANCSENTAWSNLKYITGYLDNNERNRILGLFKEAGISISQER